MAELSRLGQPDQSGWTTLDRIGAAARKAREYISPWGVVSPTDVAGFAPGGGLVQAWQDSGRGLANLKAGNYGQAAADYGSMALNTAGELLPVAKLGMAMLPAAKGRGNLGGMAKWQDNHADWLNRIDEIAAEIGYGKPNKSTAYTGSHYREYTAAVDPYGNILPPGAKLEPGSRYTTVYVRSANHEEPVSRVNNGFNADLSLLPDTNFDENFARNLFESRLRRIQEKSRTPSTERAASPTSTAAEDAARRSEKQQWFAENGLSDATETVRRKAWKEYLRNKGGSAPQM